MKKKILIIISIFLILTTSFLVYYVNDFYKAVNIDNYMQSTDTVKVIKIDSGYWFDGPGNDTALIFYPGAKVETTAYAKLMNILSSEGIDCFLIDMPFKLAFLGIDKATQIINNYKYNYWCMAGHSLGGVAASEYVYNNPQKINSLILLGSYPTKKIDDNVKFISIYGENDGVLNKKSYNDSKKYWSKNSYEKVIEGGNHANFGDYGEQKGDNKSTITSDEQKDQTAMFIKESLIK
jgi:hypothetical protein